MAIEKVLKIKGDVTDVNESLDETKKKVESLEDSFEKTGDVGKEALDDVSDSAKEADKETGFLGDSMKSLTDIGKKLKADLSAAFTKLEGAVSGTLNGIGKASRSMGLGFKVGKVAARGLTVALAALGIPLLIAAVAALVEWFKNFEKGQKVLQTALNATGAVIGQLGKAFSALISGDIQGMKDAILGIGSAIQESVQATKDLFDATAELTQLTQKYAVENAKLKQDMEANRKILEDTTLASSKRLDALDKVTAATKQILANETELAKKREQALQAELANENNYERQREIRQEIADIQAGLIDKTTELATIEYDAGKQRREIQNADAAAAESKRLSDEEEKKRIQEKLDLEKKNSIEYAKNKKELEEDIALEKKKFIAEGIQDEQARIDALRVLLEQEKELELERLQVRVDTAEKGTQAELDAIELLAAKKLEFKEKGRTLDQEEVTYKQNIVIEKEAQDLEDLERTNLLEEQRRQYKVETLETLSNIAGQETKLGKALLVAKALLQAREFLLEAKGTLFTAKQSATKATVKGAEAGADVAAGAAKTSAAAPFPANIPLIVGYAAQAVGIVSAIKGAVSATKQAAAQAGASTGGDTGLRGPQVSGPSFNVVGQGGANQIGNAVGGAVGEEINNQPLKTYVVASDVTTQQALDRQVSDRATLG